MKRKSFKFVLGQVVLMISILSNVACQRTDSESETYRVGNARPNLQNSLQPQNPNGTNPGQKASADEDVFQVYEQVYNNPDSKLKLIAKDLAKGKYRAEKVGVKVRNWIKATNSPTKIGDETNSLKLLSLQSTKEGRIELRSSVGLQEIANIKIILPLFLEVTPSEDSKTKLEFKWNELSLARKAGDKSEKIDNTSKNVKAELSKDNSVSKAVLLSLSNTDLVDFSTTQALEKLNQSGTITMTKIDQNSTAKFNYVARIITDTAEIFVMTVFKKIDGDHSNGVTEQPESRANSGDVKPGNGISGDAKSGSKVEIDPKVSELAQ